MCGLNVSPTQFGGRSEVRIIYKVQLVKFIDMGIFAQDSGFNVLALVPGSDVNVQLDWLIGV